MYQRLADKKAKLAVIGLGYVGLPIALEFAKKFSTVGFDINAGRVEMMKRREDPSGELDAEAFNNADIVFSADPADLKDVNFFIVAVPTPIDLHTMPDLKPLLGATRTVGRALKKGDYVVYESTVYPGCTEEDCIPILELESGLKFVEDFKVGYSPERINPGDKEHTLTRITKVVSGCDDESLETVAQVYGSIITAGVYRAQSIKVAEAAKIIENTQRDLNIALMNELSMIFDRLKINTYEVLQAAGTKWNFLNFSPGLVGGHCIGVDPYYLTYKSKALGHDPHVILSGRAINDSMGAYIAGNVVKRMIKQGKNPAACRVLVMGATFKENVGDIRNSKVVDVIRELQNYSVCVDVVDPQAESDEVEHEYGFRLCTELSGGYDAIVLAVAHREYMGKSQDWFTELAAKPAVFADVKGIYKGKITEMEYWSL
ncbi:MAG: nucleotide sugar dehydrogenase [Bacteroidota bacterium]